MEVIGVVEVAINNRASITLTDFAYDKSQNTKVHKGAFGAFGTSQGPPDVAGTFSISIPRTGLEFDFEGEFAGDGGSIKAKSPGGGWKRGFRAVKIAKTSHTTNNATGETKQTYAWVAMKDTAL